MPSSNHKYINLPECLSGSLELKTPFALSFGQKLPSPIVSYSIFGDLSKQPILVLGGISSDQYVVDCDIEGIFVKGWWDPLIGVGKSINLNHYCVISLSYLDGTGRSDCSLEQQLDKNQIQISTFDQAKVIKQLLIHLNIKKLAAIIGSSYGGMVAMAFAARYPELLEQFIAICAHHESDSKNTALRDLQRKILQFCNQAQNPKEGLILARSIATLGYRGEDELQSRFPNQINIAAKTVDFPIVDYLQKQGEKFSERFSVDRFINLSLSVDLHKIEPIQISTKCLLIGIEGDLIAPPKTVKQLSQDIGNNAVYAEISSKVGHDGFLKEFEQLSKLIQSRLGK
jgi:homoserine O-acetyltransferase/O-succinyltransferase